MSAVPPRVYAVVLARRGSRSILRKNLETVGGQPLVLRAVEQAFRIAQIDEVVVSTDDREVLSLVAESGALLVDRPAHLATDDARSAPAALHALTAVGAAADDVAVLLQPTSPLRSDEDVIQVIEGLDGHGSSIAARETGTHPFKALIETANGYRPVRDLADLESPRQALPPALVPNGAVYAIRCADLAASGSFLVQPMNLWVMPQERSLDIDTPADLARARQAIEQEGISPGRADIGG